MRHRLALISWLSSCLSLRSAKIYKYTWFACCLLFYCLVLLLRQGSLSDPTVASQELGLWPCATIPGPSVAFLSPISLGDFLPLSSSTVALLSLPPALYQVPFAV